MATTMSTRAAKKAPEAARQPSRKARPNEEKIRLLAYRLYERRRENGTSGDAAADWIEAERQLTGS